MATLAIDAYSTFYEERADLAFEWTEELVNRYGLTSHSTRPGDGVQYDPTGVVQFADFGFREPGIGTLRRIPGGEGMNFARYEGNHESSGVYVFAPPVQSVTFTDARLKYVYTGAGSSFTSTIYAVAADDFLTRQIDASTGYRMTYRAEFHAGTWGRPRRYRCDSLEYEQAHTSTAVAWTFAGAEGVLLTSPNIASVVNEVMSRPGWKSGNRIALINAPRHSVSTAVFAPDFVSEISPPGEIAIYPFCADAKPTLTLTY